MNSLHVFVVQYDTSPAAADAGDGASSHPVTETGKPETEPRPRP